MIYTKDLIGEVESLQRKLLDKLTETYGKKVASKVDEVGFGGKDLQYSAALVLFGDMHRDLPKLIKGEGGYLIS